MKPNYVINPKKYVKVIAMDSVKMDDVSMLTPAPIIIIKQNAFQRIFHPRRKAVVLIPLALIGALIMILLTK